MLSHVYLSTNNFERALSFYRPLMTILNLHERFCDFQRAWAAWESAPGIRPLFVIGRPYDGGAASVGNGQMVALSAPSRSVVDEAYAIVLRHGGTDEGAPGLRPEYHANYYGAYFRDPDGNKLSLTGLNILNTLLQRQKGGHTFIPSMQYRFAMSLEILGFLQND